MKNQMRSQFQAISFRASLYDWVAQKLVSSAEDNAILTAAEHGYATRADDWPQFWRCALDSLASSLATDQRIPERIKRWFRSHGINY
jgi:hypothetical protein